MSNAIARLHAGVEEWCARRPDLGLFLLRLGIGAHLVWSTQDNVFSWARMLEFRDFLEKFGFPFPLFCAMISVGAQFLGGLALVTGLCTRFAAAVLAFNFVVAVWMVDSTRPYPAAFAALAILAACLCLTFTGAGRWSLDHRWRGA